MSGACGAREILLETRTRATSRILCGRGIRGTAKECEGRVLAVVDENVARLYPRFLEELKAFALVEILAAGEASKNFGNFERLVNLLAQEKFSRSDTVLAVGGGVTTDLAGFVAATYMRGIGYASLPTSLLAMVDAAIGGKCGIDLAAGKNLAGAFYQPARVAADLDFLNTLPEREKANGIAEIIKYGVIADEGLFPLLDDFEENAEEIVFRCMRLKCEVVQADERESGKRMLLNFGHTIGHAIEKSGGYRKFSHGVAVANGMIYESRFLERAGLVKPEDTAKIEAYVDRFGLRIREKFDAREIFDAVQSDKKRRGGTMNFTGFEKIGVGKVYKFPMQEVEARIKEIFA